MDPLHLNGNLNGRGVFDWEFDWNVTVGTSLSTALFVLAVHLLDFLAPDPIHSIVQCFVPPMLDSDRPNAKMVRSFGSFYIAKDRLD